MKFSHSNQLPLSSNAVLASRLTFIEDFEVKKAIVPVAEVLQFCK
jgi:hypothetical protein